MKHAILGFLLTSLFLLSGCSDDDDNTTSLSNKEKAIALITAFETGSSTVLDYISDQQYIQHNLNFPDGKDALTGFFTDMPTGIEVTIHRVIEEGDLVTLHSTYGGVWNNGTPQVAFDIFRFENGLIVEHWDNLQDEVPASQTVSGRSMVDGPTEVTNLNETETNKLLVSNFVNDILVNGGSNFTDYISAEQYHQHNPSAGDGLEGLAAFATFLEENNIAFSYTNVPIIVAEGNFVLTAAEGIFGDNIVAYYDLFRIENGKIVEHWDVIQNIPPESEWQNSNGKF